jgi:hypothetical protein
LINVFTKVLITVFIPGAGPPPQIIATDFFKIEN